MRSAMVKSGFILGGGVLGILVTVGYALIVGVIPFHSANDSPATAHGGSFSVHGNLNWGTVTGSNAYQTVFSVGSNAAIPNYLSFDGVDPNPATFNPGSGKGVKASANWKVEIQFRDNPPTTLKICSNLNAALNDCAMDATALTTTFYLLPGLDANGNPAGTFTRQTIDRKNGGFGSIFYDLSSCLPKADDPHPACGHPNNVTLSTYVSSSGTVKTYPSYHCVDGVCSIGIDHK